jgi:hypothetical protein
MDAEGAIAGVREASLLPTAGGLIRAVSMGTLGYLFLLKGLKWAKLTFAAVEYLTSLTAVVLTANAVRAGRAEFDVTIAALVGGYLTAGLIVTFGKRTTAGDSTTTGIEAP